MSMPVSHDQYFNLSVASKFKVFFNFQSKHYEGNLALGLDWKLKNALNFEATGRLKYWSCDNGIPIRM